MPVGISDLDAATTPLSGVDKIPILQDGVTKQADAQDVADLANPYADAAASAAQAAAEATATALVHGISWKQAVRVATTVAGTLATDYENGDTVDGVALATGDRILLKNQASQLENGIYVVAASGAPSRAADANTGAELVNATVYVSEGTANADSQWTCTTNATITIGASNIVFAQITAGAGAISALTGDVSASGPGSAAATLATVNSNVGTFGSATKTAAVTFDGKGRATAAAEHSIVGKHMVPVMAVSMTPRQTNGCAAIAYMNGASNQPDVPYLAFDSSSTEYAEFSIPAPQSWNESTVTFEPIWAHGATVTNFGVVWQLQGVAVSNDDTLAATFGAAQSSADTGGTTDDHYVGPESSAITIAGSPAAGDTIYFRVNRLPSDGSDTLAVDARLLGLRLYITTDAMTDA